MRPPPPTTPLHFPHTNPFRTRKPTIRLLLTLATILTLLRHLRPLHRHLRPALAASLQAITLLRLLLSTATHTITDTRHYLRPPTTPPRRRQDEAPPSSHSSPAVSTAAFSPLSSPANSTVPKSLRRLLRLSASTDGLAITASIATGVTRAFFPSLRSYSRHNDNSNSEQSTASSSNDQTTQLPFRALIDALAAPSGRTVTSVAITAAVREALREIKRQYILLQQAKPAPVYSSPLLNNKNNNCSSSSSTNNNNSSNSVYHRQHSQQRQRLSVNGAQGDVDTGNWLHVVLSALSASDASRKLIGDVARAITATAVPIALTHAQTHPFLTPCDGTSANGTPCPHTHAHSAPPVTPPAKSFSDSTCRRVSAGAAGSVDGADVGEGEVVNGVKVGEGRSMRSCAFWDCVLEAVGRERGLVEDVARVVVAQGVRTYLVTQFELGRRRTNVSAPTSAEADGQPSSPLHSAPATQATTASLTPLCTQRLSATSRGAGEEVEGAIDGMGEGLRGVCGGVTGGGMSGGGCAGDDSVVAGEGTSERRRSGGGEGVGVFGSMWRFAAKVVRTTDVRRLLYAYGSRQGSVGWTVF